MTDDQFKQQIKSAVSALIRSEDRAAYDAFGHAFETEADAFVEHMTCTLLDFSVLVEHIQDGEERKLHVAAILHDGINQHIVSFQLFLSGHLVAAGALFRLALEYVALSILCSAKDSSVLERFESDRYSTQDAIHHLGKFAEKVGIDKAAAAQIKAAYVFLHKYAHPSKLTLATGTSFHAGGQPVIGANFDPEKLNEYRKEIANRVGLASVFPSIVKIVGSNMATW
ncbi:hypothetical protein [Burkholderia sp. Z1]|uniref:hypothetical protein n=1 Tax=Burkholderia sp. Z1 TaxID=2759039 RepID=UPI00186895C8|nr:hypothetical protein [Burkholderia sp. Z1]